MLWHTTSRRRSRRSRARLRLCAPHINTKRRRTFRSEAARQNERLRGILLDALAHDFTTPLTSIKGAITAVRSAYQHEAEEDDLLEVVEEESDKLTGMIDETVAMARIEPGR